MGNRLLVILVVVLMVMVLGGGTALYFFVLRPEPIAIGEIYAFPEVFMTDLANRGHVRLEISLELEKKSLGKELDTRAVQLIDEIYRTLRSKTKEDLTGGVGQDGLRQELLERLNGLLTTGKIVNIYFDGLVID